MTKASLKIQGHSKFEVSVIEENGSVLVRKSAKTKEDSQRLYNQFKKQTEFKSDILKALKVSSFGYTDDKFSFECPYSNAYDFSEHFLLSPITKITESFDKLLLFIETNIHNSVMINFHIDIFNKHLLVHRDISKMNLPLDFSKVNEILIDGTDIYLPKGYCHGDLTLSNMLFSRTSDEIFLFDFLDSFIDSPVIDIVKLRQDTKFLWSLELLQSNPIDSTKLSILLNTFDRMIHNRFLKYDWYRLNYRKLEMLNFLRMIKYSNNKTLPIILSSIERIINEHVNSPSSGRIN